LQPPLAVVYRDGQRRETERSLATDILADYAADQPKVLADLLMDADEKQFAVLYPRCEGQKEGALPVLGDEVDRKPPPGASEEVKEKLAKRQANAAAALLRMQQPAKVWPLLEHSPDPRLRSYLIHRLALLRVDAGQAIERLEKEKEVSIRRALLLSLGEYGTDQVSASNQRILLPRVLRLYRDDPDPGVHGAAEWLLRRWQIDQRLKEMNENWAKDQPQRELRAQQIKQGLARRQEEATPQWYVNGQGQTMVVIPGPVVFLMGSPSTEPGRTGGAAGNSEQRHGKRIGRSFAISAREVTVEQFLRFRKNHVYNKQYSLTSDSPMNQVSWYDAAAYCDWLSKQEGIPKDQWCYLPNDEGEYAEGMKLAPDYLKRTGYRLPSEAEWEYACRAKAVTSRYYGETEELLGKYAWYTKYSLDRGMLPGVRKSRGGQGGMKPNDFGLFDMLGNAVEWCQESYVFPPENRGEISEDVEDNRPVTDKLGRALRGCSFLDPALLARSALRLRFVPQYHIDYLGFRPARTLLP
jgi:formylglycine-generating enzyme required for sulfatase activity